MLKSISEGGDSEFDGSLWMKWSEGSTTCCYSALDNGSEHLTEHGQRETTAYHINSKIDNNNNKLVYERYAQKCSRHTAPQFAAICIGGAPHN